MPEAVLVVPLEKIITAMILVVASTALFVYKYFEDKEYAEKWKDYDECGIQ